MTPVKRVEWANAGGLRLVADLTEPGGARSVVVLVHGFGDNRASKGRFPRLAAALAGRGLASLAFDCAGCGESDDAVVTWEGLAGDLASALAFARDRFARVALLGHSAGARVCLLGCDDGVTTMVLTGCALDGVDYDWSRVLDAGQQAELARSGRVTLPRHDRAVVVGKTMLDGFAAIDRARLLARARCPLFIVNGDGDDEERVLTATVGRARAHLPAGSRVAIIGGAPHGFGAQYDEVLALVVPWLAERLA